MACIKSIQHMQQRLSMKSEWFTAQLRKFPCFLGRRETMDSATAVERIRMAIADQLHEFGAQGVDSIQETILIRGGLFCGRKFQCSGYVVVWFLEEDEIKFFGPCGDLLKASTAVNCLHASELIQARLDDEQRRAA